MKTKESIYKVLFNLPDKTKYPAVTYEQGIEEALLWVLEEIPDDEFEYIKAR